VVRLRGESAVACSFDVRALVGRTFSSILDEIASGWRLWGFLDGGLAGSPIVPSSFTEEEDRENARIKREFTPIADALCEGTIELADIDETAVPRWVWCSGRWGFHCNGKRECLEARTAAGQKVEFYTRTFREPAAGGGDKKSTRSGKKRGGGNTEYDDTAEVQLARDEFKKMKKPSKLGAARTAIDRRIAEGYPVAAGSTPAQWARRIARKL
jgi:hypothetical protein